LVSIGLSFGAGAIDTVVVGGTTANLAAPAYHGVFNVDVSAFGQTFLGGPAQPSLLNSQTIDVSAAAPGTLNIFVTSQNLTSPTGFLNFLSGFTSNFINGPLTVTEQTFLDTGNGQFTTTGATVTALGSHTFTGPGLETASALLAHLAGAPYSVTEVFTIVTTGTGIGNTNDTINLSASAVPLPGALPLFAGGLVGLWALGRRRRKHATV